MAGTRRQLPRLAALVLLLWLFTSSIAFAQACNSPVDIGCGECCTEAKPATVRTASAADVGATQIGEAPAAIPPTWYQAAPLPNAAALRIEFAPRSHSPGLRIPIVFLRLAL
jgi:hypothetical protein